jgi:hypothetical protein
MNYEEFRRQLGKAGLNNRSFAALLGIQAQSVNNLKSKGVVPDQLAMIACFMAEYKEMGKDFLEVVGKVINRESDQHE